MKKSKKIVKINNSNIKKLKIFSVIFFILLILLIIRLAYLQFIKGSWLSKQASAQQTSTITITPSRGIIYDKNGKVLAVSAEVDTVTVNPSRLKYSDGDIVPLEYAAQSFSDIFGLDYTKTLEKLNTATGSITIASKVENDKIASLEEWMETNKISSGISIESSIKRYYPYNTLACHTLGFTGTDSNGLFGLENSLDSTLSGTVGKVVTLTDSVNSEIPDEEQSHIAAQDGSNVYLTLDVKIQSIAEKYLSQAVIDNIADYGTVIIMEPSTGNVLAMANYPNYDLNTPFTPIDESILSNWETLSAQEQTDYLYDMWRNKAVQNTYEPGSTYKILTAAIGLEEGIIDAETADSLYCAGTEYVDDIPINCWRHTRPHQGQSLKQALANSCNPAFIQLGLKIGAPTLYKYYDAFGLLSSTNSQFYGESNSVFYNKNSIRKFELATMSFGQGITITPLQLVTAISAIANEGVLMQPRIVDKIVDPNTGSTTTPEPVTVRQVVSKETAGEVMDMLDYAVSDGTGKYADVKGYSIGGKSGTSENLGNGDGTYVASFIGLSPTVNTQVVVLVALYNPQGDSYQGGEIAGPVVGQILSEILPYIGVASTSNSESDYKTKTMPDLKNQTIGQAKNILNSYGFDIHIDSSIQDTELITNQMPKKGAHLLENADVFLYTENSDVSTSVTVPNFKGMSVTEAINVASEHNLNIALDGSGIVISQDIAADTSVEIGSVVNLTLKSELNGGW